MTHFDSKNAHVRIYQGIGAVGLTFLLLFVERVISVPLFSSFWGPRMLSDWLVIFSLGAPLSLIVTGIPTHTANLMTNHAINKDFQKMNSTYSNGLFSIFIVSILITAGFLSVQRSMDMKNLLGLSTMPQSQVTSIALTIILFTLATLSLSLPFQAYRAFGMFARGQMVGNIRQILLLVSIVGGLLLGFSPIGVALLYLGSLSFDLIWLIRDLPRRLPSLKATSEALALKKMVELSMDGLLFSLFMAGPVLALQGNILVASNKLGAHAILGYILMRTIVNFFYTGLYSFGRVFWQEISLLALSDNIDGMKKLNLMLIKTSTFFSSVLAAFLFFAGPDLISVWSGVNNVISGEVVAVLSFSIISKAIYGSSSISCMALSKHRFLSLSQLAGGLITIIATALFASKYGLMGVALSFVVPDLFFFSLPSLMIAWRLSGESIRTAGKEIFMPVCVIFLLSLLLSRAALTPLFETKALNLLAGTLFYFPIAGVLTFKGAFNADERSQIEKMIKNILSRKSDR